MFSSNNRISLRQMKRLIIFDIFSVSCMITSYIAVNAGGKDGLWTVILGTVAALAYGILMILFHRQIGEDYFDYAERTIGRIGTIILQILYFIKIFYSVIFVTGLFSNIIHDTLLSETNGKILTATLLFIGAYQAYLGMEERGRIAEILYYIVLTPVFLFLLAGLSKLDVTNLMPLFISDGNSVLKGSYEILLLYSSLELLIFSLPYVREREKNNHLIRNFIGAVAAAGILNLLFYINTVGILGTTEASQKLWSSITVMQVIDMPGGFVKRQDALLLGLWVFSVFTLLSTLLFYLGYVAKKAFHGKKHRSYILLLTILVFLLVSVNINTEELFLHYGKYMMYIGMPQSVILPALLILAGKLKGRRKE